MTVESLIQEMKFGTEFIFALIMAVCLALVIGEMRRAREAHRIWKELRKLEKEKLEAEKKVADKELETYSHSRFINVDILADQMKWLSTQDDDPAWLNCIQEVEFFITQQFR